MRVLYLQDNFTNESSSQSSALPHQFDAKKFEGCNALPCDAIDTVAFATKFLKLSVIYAYSLYNILGYHRENVR